MRLINKEFFTGLLAVLLVQAAVLVPFPVSAQAPTWVQEERMRQTIQRQQWQEWQRQEQMRQMYDRQQWLLWRQQEQLRRRFQQ